MYVSHRIPPCHAMVDRKAISSPKRSVNTFWVGRPIATRGELCSTTVLGGSVIVLLALQYFHVWSMFV